MKKAAGHDHVEAQRNLAVLYSEGKGVPKDPVQAVFWLRKAADHCDAGAQNDLGKQYAFGTGVEQSYLHAYTWLLISAASHGTTAPGNLAALKPRMTEQDIAAAQSLAARWLAEHRAP